MKKIVVGIDLGTHVTRVVMAEYIKGKTIPRLIATGSAESMGLHHGYVINIEQASNSLKKAINEAEKNSGIRIEQAILSIGGISLNSEISNGSAVISKIDKEVTNLDVAKAIAESEKNLKLLNKKIIYVTPVMFKLDGKEVLGKPEGMKGLKLEVKTLFITCLEQHLENLLAVASKTGINVINIIPSPLAASLVALTEKQKMVGCILVNIGAETVSIAVFENNDVVSLHIFAIGSTDITNDIALGLQIPIEEAEQIKTGTIIGGDYSKKKLDEIIEARLSDIFELIENHLKKIKRNGLLPAGVIMTGGGSRIASIEDLSKNLLKLPSKIGSLENFSLGVNSKIRDSSWFVAYGLCLYEKNISNQDFLQSSLLEKTLKSIKDIFSSITHQLLP